jgi:hypothetical protein
MSGGSLMFVSTPDRKAVSTEKELRGGFEEHRDRGPSRCIHATPTDRDPDRSRSGPDRSWIGVFEVSAFEVPAGRSHEFVVFANGEPVERREVSIMGIMWTSPVVDAGCAKIDKNALPKSPGLVSVSLPLAGCGAGSGAAGRRTGPVRVGSRRAGPPRGGAGRRMDRAEPTRDAHQRDRPEKTRNLGRCQ